MKKDKVLQVCYLLGWLIVGIIMIYMHCYRLGDIPYGMDVDEAGMGYDAWCLAKYGVDRYMNSYPVYLINFSGGQSAMYAYLCAPFVYFLGITEFSVRIPAMIAAFVTLIFAILIVKKIWPEKKWVWLIAGLLYAVCPIFTMLFRIGLDCNLMLCVSTVFLYFLIHAIETQKKRYFILAGVLGGSVLYSYVLSHLIMPLFLLATVIYLIVCKKIDLKRLICMGVPLFLLAVPLILFQMINILDLEEFRIGIFTIPKLYRYRSGDMSLELIKGNILELLKNTLLEDNVKYDTIDGYYTMYLISVPFIVCGAIHSLVELVRGIRKKEIRYQGVCFLWFICVYLVGLTLGLGGPNAYRMNAIFIAYLIFLLDGIWLLYKSLQKIGKKAVYVSATILTVVYGWQYLSFAQYYFNDYVKDTYMLDCFNFRYTDVLSYIDENYSQDVIGRTTYIAPLNQSYIYYLCSTMTDIYDYNVLADDLPYTMYLWASSYKNYCFNLPEEVDPVGNYMIPDDAEFEKNVVLYEEYGFQKEHIENYYFLTNPWLEAEEGNSECVVSWDHGVDEYGKLLLDSGETTVVSGWAYDSTNKKIWDDIIVDVDGTYYVAEVMEREDVAQALGEESYLNCGFHFTLDTCKVSEAEKIRFICINYDEKACYVYNME